MSVNQLVPVELSNCVKESTMATFEMICGTELAHSYESNENASCEGIASIISLVGDVSWSLLLCLPRDTACGLSQRFTGFEIPFDSADMGDAVGELVNVLAGDVSARLDALGVKAELSLPTVARGHGMDLMLPGSEPAISLHFTSPDGPFWIKIAVGHPHNIRRSGS